MDTCEQRSCRPVDARSVALPTPHAQQQPGGPTERLPPASPKAPGRTSHHQCRHRMGTQLLAPQKLSRHVCLPTRRHDPFGTGTPTHDCCPALPSLHNSFQCAQQKSARNTEGDTGCVPHNTGGHTQKHGEAMPTHLWEVTKQASVLVLPRRRDQEEQPAGDEDAGDPPHHTHSPWP